MCAIIFAEIDLGATFLAPLLASGPEAGPSFRFVSNETGALR